MQATERRSSAEVAWEAVDMLERLQKIIEQHDPAWWTLTDHLDLQAVIEMCYDELDGIE